MGSMGELNSAEEIKMLENWHKYLEKNPIKQ